MPDKYLLYKKVSHLLRKRPDIGDNIVALWLDNIINALENGKPVVYHQYTMFTDIFIAMDLQPLCTEMWDLIFNTIRKSGDAAVFAGISGEFCSFNKACIGSLLRKTIPPPSMIVSPLMPCQNSLLLCQALSYLTGVPMYILDVPYDFTNGMAVEYWVNQYKGLISFLREYTGKKLDYDRLKEVIEESNRCVSYWQEAMELKKMKPTPHSGTFSAGYIAGLTSFGLPESTALVKKALDRIKKQTTHPDPGILEEKLRVIWFHYPVFWDLSLMDWMKEMGAVIPFSLFDDFRVEPVDTSTPENMIKGMAKRALHTPMGKLGRGGYQSIIDELAYIKEEWQGDCVIIPANLSCRWLRSGIGLIRDACEEYGIPLFIFDIDLVDPKGTSAQETREKIEQFLAIVMMQKDDKVSHTT